MALSDQRHTVRFPLPHEVVTDRATVIKAPVYLDGALVAPTGGGTSTVSIYDESNVAIVTDATVVVSASTGEYTVPADTFAATDVSERIRVVWTLVISGTTYVAENDGIVVVRELYPAITDADLFRRLSSLDPAGSAPITAQSNYQDYIDEAWAELVGTMISDGTRPSWVMSPSSTRKAHTELTLAYIFDDLASRLDLAYQERADRHRNAYEAAYRRMTALLDKDDDGIADHRGRKGIDHPIFWLGTAR